MRDSTTGIGIHPPIKKGADSVANAIKLCPCGCGQLLVDIGIADYTSIICIISKKEFPSNGVWWLPAKRFTKKSTSKQEESMVEVTFKEIKKKVPISAN